MSNYGDEWRDTEFGEGQERYYGGLPQQEPAPQRSGPEPVEPSGGGSGGRGKGLLVVGAGVLAVAVAVGGAYLATQRGGDDDPTPTAQGSSAAESPSAQPSAAPAEPTSKYQPLTSGWQVASGNDEFPVVFDVPAKSKTFKSASEGSKPEWEIVDQAAQQYGFAHPQTRIPLAMTDFAATYRSGHCKTSASNALAFLGFYKSTSDAPAAASEASDKFLKAMSLKENGKDRVKYTEGQAKTVKVNGGKTSAVQIRTNVPWSRSDDSFCVQKERELVVTTVPTSNGTGTVIASRIKGAPGGLDTKTFDKILKSIRPRA